MPFSSLRSKSGRLLSKNIKTMRNRLVALDLFNYKKIVVFEKLLEGPMTSPESKIEVDLTQLSSDDVVKTKRFRTKKGVLERVRKGHTCFAALKNGVVVSYCWVAFNNIFVKEFQKEINFAEDSAYLYDAFTVKEYRGKGIFPNLCTSVFSCLEERGYRRVFGMVNANNPSSLRAFEKVWKKLGTITYFKIFRFKRVKLNRRLITENFEKYVHI